MIKINFYRKVGADLIIDIECYDLYREIKDIRKSKIFDIILRINLFPEYLDDLISINESYVFKQDLNG